MWDVHWLDLDTLQWHAVPQPEGAGTGDRSDWPCSRTGHSLAVRSQTGSCYVFGGMSRAEDLPGSGLTWLNDLWQFRFDTHTWRKIEPRGPGCPAGRYSQISWIAGDALMVFGGDSLNCLEYFDDLWCMDLNTETWKKLDVAGDRPTARSGHVGLAWEGSLYMFGGEKPKRQRKGETRGDQLGGAVEYSNTLYQMPHFVERTTSLKAIAARLLLSTAVLPSGADFLRTCREHQLPPALINYLDRVRPRGKRRRQTATRLAGQKRQRTELSSGQRSLLLNDDDCDTSECSASDSIAHSEDVASSSEAAVPPAGGNTPTL